MYHHLRNFEILREDVWCVKENDDWDHKDYQVKHCQNFLADHTSVFLTKECRIVHHKLSNFLTMMLQLLRQPNLFCI